MNPRINRTIVAATVAALPFAGGCMWTPELARVKQDIASQLPGVTFDHNVSLAIGPGGMALIRAVTGFVPRAEDARGWLKDVSRVELAVYHVDAGESTPRIETPSRIEKMVEDGWEMAVRARDGDESVWVLYKLDDDSVREVFVVSLDKEELVIVKVKGRLERLIARALDTEGGRSFGRALHDGT